MDLECINESYLLEKTKLNSCAKCHFVTAKMIKLPGEYFNSLCYTHAEKSGVLSEENTVIYLNDSKFVCPAESCNSTNISFWEHFYGNCCEAGSAAAFETIHDVDLTLIDFTNKINGKDLTKISDALNDLKEMEDEAKRDFENAKNKFAALETHRKQIKNKAVAIFTEARDSLLDEDQENKEDKLSDCKICFEKYDKFERFHCTLLCGHRACLRCLKAVPEKLCSTCRQPYTLEQIIKLY